MRELAYPEAWRADTNWTDLYIEAKTSSILCRVAIQLKFVALFIERLDVGIGLSDELLVWDSLLVKG